MDNRHERAVAIVGVGAILPDAPNAPAFWRNVRDARYSITDVSPDRWNAADYYDPDPRAPDKTYSKIGGWVRGFEFDWKKYLVPPRVADAMDEGQKWALTMASEALADYGYPERPLDTENTGVILGAAMGGELQYLTVLRVNFPEFSRALSSVSEFSQLPADVRTKILTRWHEAVDQALPPITEDSMPGELANILSGRVANALNLRGPNFVTDAACASSYAAIDAAVDLLVGRHCDAVLSGGVDRNMGASTFVKFAKIGALSATGTRPFGDGADGFVMGEGCAAFLLKRLADAERDGDRVYAVIRGVGGSSDGRGKGITAPNPAGQKLAVARAWKDAGLDPATAGLVEAHGTSTKVGDQAEVESLAEVFGAAALGSIALGSAKSNVGHLKAAAGAAGLLKAVFAIHEKQLPPTLNADPPSPSIDFGRTPFVPNHELREWKTNGEPRRCGVSAYGFGGTNFHVVLEEHVPGALTKAERPSSVAVPAGMAPTAGPRPVAKAPLRGIAALGAETPEALTKRLEELTARVKSGFVPEIAAPAPEDLRARERLVIDFGDHAQLLKRLTKATKALATDTPRSWRALQSQGVFRGSGPRQGKLAFLFPGQGSQYLNMCRDLAAIEPVVEAVFAEADRVTEPLLGRPLTSYLYVDSSDPKAVEAAEDALRQTAVTQPAVLTVNVALMRLLAEYGIEPDLVMGHSLGEYAGLVAAGILPLADALEASAVRGREMTRVGLDDNGRMAAVMAPPDVLEKVLAGIDGYVVPANLNSPSQCVIGGASAAVEAAIQAFEKLGHQAVPLQVSHAFHTKIVAPAGESMRKVLDRLRISPPRRQLVANVTGGLYPNSVEEIKDTLVRQVASPVQWVKGTETLYEQGVRTFVEVGPKRALKGFIDELLSDRPDTVSLSTNHPRAGGVASFNQALCGLYAAGYGAQEADATDDVALRAASDSRPTPEPVGTAPQSLTPSPADGGVERLTELLSQALQTMSPQGARRPYDRNEIPAGSIVVTGTGLGLPGAHKPVMDPLNAERILRGEQFVDLIPERFRYRMAEKQVTRLVKKADGSGHFETIDDTADVIKLAGRPGPFDLTAEYGVPAKLVEALDFTSQLAIAAGLDALREAGIPLLQTHRKTTTGKYLPDRWLLPEAMRDETGVIFASAFPGYDRFADEARRFFTYDSRKTQRKTLDDLRLYTRDPETLHEIHRRIAELDDQLEREPYSFDRRFMLRVLAMGHSQFAEYIGARGPNTHVNAACASTAHAISLAEDWIRCGRCRRVVVVAGDNPTGDNLLEWLGTGMLATGSTATDDKVEDAALPFDRRRHGTLLGMGACALVVEAQDAVEERGMRGIVELLATEARNSAFHALRLDVEHISSVMESLVSSAERRFGLNRQVIAPHTVFMSHETFTPARGGSASAEVVALRDTFGHSASEIVVANTKGFTGHPMGVGVEDVIAVKILEHGIVPPVPNFKEVDPDLGKLTLSRGGRYPVNYAIHLAAGFGSQIAMTLTRRIPGPIERVDNRPLYEKWLSDVSGYDRASTEVAKRVLRVVDQGPPPRPTAPSGWSFGHGPVSRAAAPGVGDMPAERPAPMVVPPAPPAATVSSSPAPRPTAQAPAAPSPPAPPKPVAPAAPPSRPTPAVDPVVQKVLEIVADKTGYPTDMLELDLDLEADLGVDTVKQAETFAGVREAYDIPREDELKLRDFPTLQHVVQFVLDRRPDLAAQPAAPSATSAAAAPARTTAAPASPLRAAAKLEDADRLPRRVPVPSLRPPLDLCKPTGVVLEKGSRVVVVGDDSGVAAALGSQLAKRGVTVLTPGPAKGKPATPLTSEVLDQKLKAWLADGPVSGVFWLPALDVEPALSKLDLAAFREQNRLRVKNLFRTMRALYESVAAPGTFLVSGTRMGGLHGQGTDGATAPLGGAVAGFTKAYKRERPEALVKVVDFEVSSPAKATAELLLAEATADPGVVEVGYHASLRWTVGLEERPAEPASLTLDKDSVFLVTGAAGGITSAIVADLAAASSGTFYLLDLATQAEPGDPKLDLLHTDRERLKTLLIEEARARGEKPLPPAIEGQILELERRDAALRATQSVTAAGGTAHYRSVNLLDGPAVSAVVDEIRQQHGRLDVLVHAGGIEISRDLPQKEPKEFDLVFDIKADGFFSLLKAAEGLPIGATVVFSSVAGRFGNSGQTDYSSANALLCSLSSHLRSARPETRAIAIDWTAWGGIGMATRGSIPKLMELAGIEMIPPEVGIPTVRRELTSGGVPGELVVGGRLGILASDWDETGGLDLEAVASRLEARKRPLLMTGKVKAARLHGGFEVETTLDPKQQPFLFDHQIDGTPVLPGVMATEAFAQLATLMCPGYHVTTVEDETLEKPFKFYRNQPATYQLAAVARPGDDGEVIVRTSLKSLIQPKPELPAVEKTYFRATVRLARKALSKPSVSFKRPVHKQMPIDREAIYQVYFHGPAYQVLEKVRVDGDKAVGLMSRDLPPNASPAKAEALLAPRLVELCFQTAGIWQISTQGVLALPAALRSLSVFRRDEAPAGKRLYAEVTSNDGGEAFDAQVVDDTGKVYVRLTGYRTVVFEENRQLPK